MIIECSKCGTKYRFDEAIITEEGVWVRCKRCGQVFFQRRPTQDSVQDQEDGSYADREPALDDVILPVQNQTPSLSARGEQETLRSEAERDRADELEDAADRRETTDKPDAEDDFVDDYALEPAPRPRKNLWSPGKISAYIAILIVILGGVYLSVFPEVCKQLISLTPVAKFFGIDVAADAVTGAGVDLLNVRERFVDNRMVGSLMVIEGVAVNRNSYPISKVKVRAKLLDSSAEFVGQSDAYCGDLLSEEELVNLTEKEIRAELNNPLGKRVPNANIVTKGNIPFMIIFFNSPQKAAEYIVEVAEMEKLLR